MIKKNLVYRNIVMHANFGYALNRLIYNDSGKIVDFEFLEVNKSFLNMTGKKNLKVVGKKISEIFPNFKSDTINWVNELSYNSTENAENFFEIYSKDLQKYYKIKIFYETENTFVILLYDVTDELSIAEYAKKFLANRSNAIDYQKFTDDLFKITNAAVIIFNLFDDNNKNSVTKAYTGLGKLLDIGTKIIGKNLHDRTWHISKERYELLKKSPELYYPKLTHFLEGNINKKIISIFDSTNFNNPVYVYSIKVDNEIIGDFLIIERKRKKLKNKTLIKLYIQLIGLIFSHQDIEKRYLKTSNDLELVLEATENGYWDSNLLNGIVKYNDKYFTMLGYNANEMPHTPDIWKSLMHPIDRNTVAEKIEDSIAKGKSFESSFRMRCKNGKWKWILGKGKGFQLDKSGKPTRAVGIHIDIDNLKSIEIQLKDQENHYRALFEYSPTPLWEMDFSDVQKFIQTLLKSGVNDLDSYFTMYPTDVKKCIKLIKILNVNNAVLKLFGYKNNEDILNQFIKIIPIESYVQFLKVLKSIETHKSYCDFDILTKTKDGNSIFTHFFWKVIPGFEPNLNKVFVATVEITERVLSAQKIKDAKERLKSINDALPDMIFEMDNQGNFTYYNSQNKQDLYTKDNNFIGRNINTVMPDDIVELTMKKIKIALNTEEIQHYNYQLTINGNINYFEARMVPKGQNNVLAVVRNVTDRKRLEEEYKLLEQHRVRSQKLETIGTLAGGIAHDFNNMLTPIMGYSDMIKSQISPESPIYEDIEEILNASKRAKELVEQMLSFSRESGTKRKPVFLSTLLKETMKFIRPALLDTIKITLDIQSENDQILADPVKIHQILLNLSTNALHAMENKTGELSIGLKKIILKDKYLEEYWGLKAGKEYLQLTMTDTGQGMQKEVIDRIFEPFFTTKSEGKGTGMGLSVVHGIVKSHKGAIQVESEIGKGSKFTILFPVIHNVKVSNDNQQEEQSKLNRVGKILLIDDRPYISKMLKNMLVQQGYTVDNFISSVEALEHFHKVEEKYDLIITDRTMPDLTGIELAEKIMESGQGIPVILITGQGHDLNESNLQKKGIHKIIHKPILFHELIQAVEKLIEGK